MSKVFVLEPTRVDITTAKQYGEIVYLFDQFDNRAGIFSQEFADDIIDAALDEGFDPSRDYLLAAGGQVGLIRAVAAFISEYGRIRVLFFSSVEHRYSPVEIGVAASRKESA